MDFNWNWLVDGWNGKKVAVHCNTEEEALDFCKRSHEHGLDWDIGDSRENNTYWKIYGSAICYTKDTYAGLSFCQRMGHVILEWSDYMNNRFTKADLQDGDFVLRRNGMVELVLVSKGVLVGQCHGTFWDTVDGFNTDFTSYVHKNYDVVAVRRPVRENDFNFEIFKNEDGALLYDEERDGKVVEMTLEEVCKALRKNIKIVKK